jgi:hypothetical protein
MSGNSGTSRPHVDGCPRRGLSCECRDCLPPVCLCDLIRACQTGTPEDVRITFYAAVEAAK